MKKLLFLPCLFLLVLNVPNANAISLDISQYRGQTDSFLNYYGTTTFQSAEFEITYPSSGTGVFQPYLSIQKTGVEEGMGTDAIGQFDNKRMGNPSETDGWTHSITVGDLYQTSSGYEFLIDLNEPHNNNSLITLTDLEIYIASSGSGASPDAMSGYGTATDKSLETLGTLVYDLNRTGEATYEPVSVLMDYALWQGSGQNVDTLVYVPMNLSGFSSTDYVYTYWKFGNSDDVQDGERSNAGFEEIIVRYNSVPEPAPMILFGTGLLVIAAFGRKRFLKR